MSIQFNLFAKKHRYFDSNESLYDNFIAMCSLSFPKTRSHATQDLVDIIKLCSLNKIGYDLALMSTNELKKNIIEFKRVESGFSYRVIGLENDEKMGLIPWGMLPKNFPKKDEEILAKKDKLLPTIFSITSNAGHTHSNLNQQRIRENLVRLQLVVYAIERWMNERKYKSTRVQLINNFLSAIQTQIKSLFHQDEQVSTVLYENLKIKSVWTNPLLDNATIKTYLNENQCEKFDELQTAHSINSSYRRSSFFSIAFLPILNYIMSFDSLDYLFDIYNICLDCGRFF